MNENLLFLDITDKFVTQMITGDVALLANKCATLMACDVATYNFTVFTKVYI